jgi:uncharacterized damage-inducible protein DinB
MDLPARLNNELAEQPNSFRSYFLMLAYYNQWANQQLYTRLLQLTPAQLNLDCGGYFQSLLKTANHLLVGDVLWFERINAWPSSDYALDQLLYADIELLRLKRDEIDQCLVDFISTFNAAFASHWISYLRRNIHYREPLTEVLAHLFNHQTHHRGQMHSMLLQLTGESLALDLIYFQREHANLYR